MSVSTVTVNASTPNDVMIGGALLDRLGALLKDAVRASRVILVADDSVDAYMATRLARGSGRAALRWPDLSFPMVKPQRTGIPLKCIFVRRGARGGGAEILRGIWLVSAAAHRRWVCRGNEGR